MTTLVQKIPYSLLVPFALLMILTPFRPMPHVLEKLLMLRDGGLTRPIDIFDLCFHLAPLILLAAKVVVQRRAKSGS